MMNVHMNYHGRKNMNYCATSKSYAYIFCSSCIVCSCRFLCIWINFIWLCLCVVLICIVMHVCCFLDDTRLVSYIKLVHTAKLPTQEMQQKNVFVGHKMLISFLLFFSHMKILCTVFFY